MPTTLMSVEMDSFPVLDTKFREAMELLRVSRSTLYRLMWSNKITHRKVGSTWRFSRQELIEKCFRDAPVPRVA